MYTPKLYLSFVQIIVCVWLSLMLWIDNSPVAPSLATLSIKWQSTQVNTIVLNAFHSVWLLLILHWTVMD
jgi:hypothetical protein